MLVFFSASVRQLLIVTPTVRRRMDKEVSLAILLGYNELNFTRRWPQANKEYGEGHQLRCNVQCVQQEVRDDILLCFIPVGTGQLRKTLRYIRCQIKMPFLACI